MATPLGNLGDITLRALEMLRARAGHRLRGHPPYAARCWSISASARNCWRCTSTTRTRPRRRLVDLLAAGKAVALVSDAGTPAISDPGARAVARVRAAGHRVVPIPGPSAAIAALSAAGVADAHFLFYGFLPAKSAAAPQRDRRRCGRCRSPWCSTRRRIASRTR
ncbi:MAG: SAM-dependent methyltransferase [Comamonadaceae bacterium]|nr:SAM-dependent methyltransferase [Comamonadaceae bacterium]